MSRVKQPKQVEEGLEHDNQDLRFGTPKEVADYRADRLKCDRLIEIGAGVGFQTVAFSRTCKSVVAIELDERRAELLKQNIKSKKIKNVTVICGDALADDVIKKAGKADIVFVDTERPASEAERKLESIRPSIQKVLELYRSAKGICIEVPPHLDVKLNCEREYISLDGKLNRLDLYFGNAKTSNVSVILLPSRDRIQNRDAPPAAETDTAQGFTFLYEINPAAVLAGLVDELASDMRLITEGTKQYFLSKRPNKSPFLTQYKIAAVCGESSLYKRLVELGCGKVVLRYTIAPQQYWRERRQFERGLEGEKTCHLFRFKDEFVICSF